MITKRKSTMLRERARRLLQYLALAALVVGVDASGARAAPFVYATNYDGGDVAQFEAGPSGRLHPLSPATVPAGLLPQSIAVSPDGRSVYVANQGGGISQYDAGADGRLSPKSPATVPTGVGMYGLTVSPDGRSVYVADALANSVLQYDVGAGGALTPKSPATVPAGRGPQGLAVSPDGRSVYVSNGLDHNLSQYDVGGGGRLAPKTPPTVPTATLPFGLAVSPDGRSLYGAQADATVFQFDIGPAGRLSPKSPPAIPGPGGQVAVSVDGRSLYGTAGVVWQYDIDTGGRLAPKSPPTVAAGGNPFGLAPSPDGRSLYVANGNAYPTPDTGSVFQYDIGASGALTAKSPAAVFAGDNTSGVAVSPQPRLPRTKADCKHGGWRELAGFKNQGDCVSFVATKGRNPPGS